MLAQSTSKPAQTPSRVISNPPLVEVKQVAPRQPVTNETDRWKNIRVAEQYSPELVQARYKAARYQRVYLALFVLLILLLATFLTSLLLNRKTERYVPILVVFIWFIALALVVLATVKYYTPPPPPLPK